MSLPTSSRLIAVEVNTGQIVTSGMACLPGAFMQTIGPLIDVNLFNFKVVI